MIKYAKIVNKETKLCEVGIGTNTEFYQSIGMEEIEVEQAYNGDWYLKGYAPTQSIEEQNKIIQQTRQHLFTEQADPIKYDYDEACAIYGISSSQALQLKLKWLEKKEEIRKNNPYKEI